MRKAVNQNMRVNILRGVFLAMVPILLLVQPRLGLEGPGHEAIETVGLLILIAGVMGRLWSILYVGAVKNAEVMQEGPYSISRNPLYFSSTLAAVGIGLMMGAVSFALLLGGAVGAILYLTARREAGFLAQHFGPGYADYAARVPFFLPDPRIFRTRPQVVFSTRHLRSNLADAMMFLSFIPLVELLDLFKQHFAPGGFSVW